MFSTRPRANFFPRLGFVVSLHRYRSGIYISFAIDFKLEVVTSSSSPAFPQLAAHPHFVPRRVSFARPPLTAVHAGIVPHGWLRFTGM